MKPRSPDPGRGQAERPPGETLTKALLALASVLFVLCLILAGGWYLSHRRGSSPDIRRLSPNQIQSLVEEHQATSTTGLRYAFFEPRIGYTLVPRAKVTAWGDTFRANELGYRTGPVEKDRATYRVLFVGDSWTYGMGVRAKEAFPSRFAEVANAHSGIERRVEAWNLALPGYNAVNELAALDAFFDLIEPDAVVLCPTTNDIDGTRAVTSSGAMRTPRRSEWGELYLDWRARYLDSYLNRTRWEAVFASYRTVRERLDAASTPFFLFFTADWVHEPVVHDFMSRADVGAPYAVLPGEYLAGEWRSASRWAHGTTEAYVVFAKIIYRMVAAELGWAPLPEPVTTRDGREVGYHPAPPAGDWRATSQPFLRVRVARFSDFKPGSEARVRQIVSGVDWRTGAVSSNPAVVVLRRKPGSSRLRVRVTSLPQARILYPLDITVTIPSPSGGTTAAGRLVADGGVTETIEIEIPADIEPGAGIDLIVEAPRSALDRRFVARAFLLTGIDPS